jgi:class 3 adenylate cyclase
LKERIIAGRSAIEGERKQVSVLFCDIVKSSALAADLGAEGFHALVNRFFKASLDAIHRYEGTINQFMGDGFMALFGAPIAHEDHARRAVLAAIEIRDGSEVDVRIGINSGFVVVGAIGDDLWMDYSAFGDTIILAARLQAAAQSREIVVSDATADLVAGYITVATAPPLQVKERTVRPLRVVGLGRRTSRITWEQPLSPFVGREREAEVLREALRLASTSEGQIVGLVGEPGLGKSRLVLEFAQESAKTATVLEGRCVSFGASFPYLPLLDIVRRICAVTVTDDRGEVQAKLVATTARLGLDPRHNPYLLYALDAFNPLEILDVDPATVKGRTFGALRDLFVAAARQRPTAVIIEDLHWIDPTSEEFLAEFSGDLAGVPILLLGTFRPGYKPPWAGKSFVKQEALRPLDPLASERVVRAVLGTDGARVGPIVNRAEGNPFFLEELARAVRDQASEEAVPVPYSVQEVLAARIDRLGEEAKRAIRIAAVLGREFTLELMNAMWDTEGEPLEYLQELKRLEFLRERLDTEQPTFVFKHALTQEVAYDGLLESRRATLHASVGAALERIYADVADEHAELLAYHFMRSTDDERAVHYLELANRRAATRNAIEEALAYYQLARERLEKFPDTETNRRRRVKLLLDQTAEFHFTHRHQEYYELLLAHQPLVESLGDEAILGGFYAQLGHRQHVMLSDFKLADQTLRHALSLCDQSGNVRDATFSETLLLWAALMLGEYDRALDHREKAGRRLQASYDPISTSWVYAGAALVHTACGRWADALAEADAGIAVGQERSDATIVSFNYTIKSYAQLEQRDWTGALASAQAALEAAPTIYFRGFPQLFIARAMCRMGERERGVEIQTAILSFLETSHHLLSWVLFSPGLIEELIILGARDDARRLVERVQAAASRGSVPLIQGTCRRFRAELGLLDAVELRQGLFELRKIGADNELALSLTTLARIEQRSGNHAAAESAAKEALAIFERLQTFEEPERASALLGSITHSQAAPSA